ncbi:amino acid ABC transporter permease [Rhodobacter sp. HX-7-19]|uniref:Amino acid ABC transporter permease n=1 Tax=Paragemmobacter kunshanensis TaxID=2583234 RepID=A0A6M1U6U9_9RHOB|nr:amino acid ABC transporter permease [Rhodobacter kunshanensis]NGQ90763.1 amino acid ABC transporter permease [Rhodobacter kunshanensis]
MTKASYVRDQMLPPQAPPVSEAGVVKWLRENLFSGWFNTILTLVGVVVIYWLVASALPWWLNSVWNAESLGQCREIVAATAGEGATGACWAMIRERWHQFIFGFYPPDLWWRPIMAFGLLFVALAPVLFSGQRRNLTAILGAAFAFLLVTLYLAGAPMAAWVLVLALILGLAGLAQAMPGKLLWFTAIYPALCFWLLWGGSIWSPVAAMLGFVVMGVAYVALVGRMGPTASAIAGVVLAALWWLILDVPVANAIQSAIPFGLQPVASDQFGGFLLAITIGVTAITFSLPIGILLALGRQSDMLIVKTLCVGFIEFIRGVPLITLLFTASLLLQYFLPPGTNFDIILRVIILVTLFAAAYLAEVIRGGLAALPRGQYEAADALGLDYWRAQRLIILPQALKISIPAIVSTFIGLFKDTTLVAFVGLMDPLKGVTQIVRADIDWKGIYWEPYIFVGVIFFVICFGMSRYSMYLERKLKTDHR